MNQALKALYEKYAVALWWTFAFLLSAISLLWFAIVFVVAVHSINNYSPFNITPNNAMIGLLEMLVQQWGAFLICFLAGMAIERRRKKVTQ